MNKQELINLILKYLDKYPADNHGQRVLDFLNSTDLFWQRENTSGHITASAWVLNPQKNKALLTHHIGLNKWFQLGGHIEEIDNDIYIAAARELNEESGLTHFILESNEIFDIDVHEIPESKKGIPAHFHYDIRILFSADDTKEINHQAEESNDVQWLSFEEIKLKTQEWSVLRMLKKTLLIINS